MRADKSPGARNWNSPTENTLALYIPVLALFTIRSVATLDLE